MKFKSKNCEIIYSIEENIVIIDSINVKLKNRGKGFAKIALKNFLEKFNLMKIEGHAYPQDNKTNMEKLLEFYKNFGFKIGSRDNKYGWEIYKK